MSMSKEEVLVVRRSDLIPPNAFHGYSSENIPETLNILHTKSFFLERAVAEENPSYKQIIPYAVLCHENAVFTVTRLSTQEETRLHQKISIGIGGHINPCDKEPGKNIWESGLERELLEEVWIQDPWERELVGFLNDDTVPVGSVHFGLVYQIRLSSRKTGIREELKMTGNFQSPGEVAEKYAAMETWSQFAFSALFPKFSPLLRSA